tara:strand:- start:2578 stop:2826 length:249 start_codon:yes stop_codon:yes gene_type:complete
MAKYYTIELTGKQLEHISNALDFYGYDVEKNKLPGEIQLHNATVKAVDNYEVSSRRKMLQAEERKLVNLFEREQLRKKNENG